MMQKNSKKGAVEMSLNLIIMLVIGLTVMGLVIGLVVNMMGKAESSFDPESGEDKVNKKNVEDAAGYFAVEPTQLNIPAGGSKKIFVKINNLGTSDTPLSIPAFNSLIQSEVPMTGANDLELGYTDISGNNCILEAKSAPYSINAKSTQVITIQFGAPKGTCSIGDEGFINIVFTPSGANGDIRDTITISTEVVSS